MSLASRAGISIKVELFGVPRLVSGLREVELVLPRQTSRRELARALAEACPALVGKVINQDLSDLHQGYVLNRGGVAFLSGDTLSLVPGDSLLVLSNQAGG